SGPGKSRPVARVVLRWAPALSTTGARMPGATRGGQVWVLLSSRQATRERRPNLLTASEQGRLAVLYDMKTQRGSAPDVSLLLQAWGGADLEAGDRRLPRFYQELRGRATVEREWQAARAWLFARLTRQPRHDS